MKKTKLLLAGALALSVVGFPPKTTSAATDSDSHTVTFTVQDAIEVTIVKGTDTAPYTDDTLLSGGDVDFGSVSILSAAGDLEVLATEPEGAAVRVRSSLGYSLQVSAGATTFAGGSGTKPVSELKFRGAMFDAVYNSYTDMSDVAMTVVASDPLTDAAYYPVDYRVDIFADDTNGVYTTTLTYTATTV